MICDLDVRERGFAAVFAFSILSLGGCAALPTPFIALEQPSSTGEGGSTGGDMAARHLDLVAAKYGDLDAALGYAEAAKAKFLQAVIEQGRLSSWTGAALIPLGTLAVGLGTLGGNPTAAAGLGLAGAGATGTAMWLRNQPAQAAYLEGFKAVNCAIEAVLPLRVNSNPGYAEFERARIALGPALARLEAAISVIEQDLDDRAFSGDAAKLARARAELPVAQAVANAGGEALAAADQVVVAAGQAGGRLVTTVDRIQAEVNTAVLANQANVAALPAVLGSLGQGFTGVTPPATAGGAENRLEGNKSGAQSAGLDTRLGELRAAAVEVAAGTRTVAGFVGALGAPRSAEALKACGVDPASLAGVPTIEPPGPFPFVAGQASQQGFVVSGGTEPYAVDLPGAPRGLTARPLQPFGSTFTIELAADVPAGTYLLVVQDRAGWKRTATIVVTGAAPAARAGFTSGGSAAGPGATTSPAGDPVFAGLADDAARHRLQRALCLVGDGPRGADGRWGPTTVSALQTYQRRLAGVAVDGKLDSTLARNLLAETPDLILARCGVPAAADVVQLRDVAGRLGREQPPLALPLGNDGRVRFKVQTAKLEPARNQVVTTLAVAQLQQASDGSRLNRQEVEAALRREVERTMTVPDLVDANFIVTFEDPGKQLDNVLTD